MSDDKPDRCFTCRFWDRGQFTNQYGSEHCRRHAPMSQLNVVIPGGFGSDRSDAVWPETKATAWCGDWAPVEGEAA